ncbi:MAG: tetratricopeptide repeat protein [Candidatus Competibacteraceae bacterium]|nr:MAG: tetratricopeptide repeat protein [Candidatus Competibacteraceae bacterium]
MFHRPLSPVSFLFLVLFIAFGSLPLSTATAQDSAIGLLKQMIAIAADNGGVGRTEELNALKQQIAALPKPARGDKQKAQIANDNGLAAYKAGQYEQAKEYFLSAYQADPADAEIAGNLALVYLKLGDSKKVIETLTVALSLAPDRAFLWVNLATYFALQNQQREAVACYALTFHFSQNQNKTRELLQKLATNNPDQPQVQQAAQQALQLSLIQGNSGTVATAPAQDSKKKADAEELARKVQAAKDKAKKESADNIQKAAQIGPKIAKDIGVEWQFSETKDPMTDARIMKSGASFEGEGQLVVNIEAVCLVESKKLSVTATAFDSSDKGVPFIQKDHKVNLLVRLNENKPKNITSKIDNYNNQLDQLGEDLVMSDCSDKITALTEGDPFIAYAAALSLGLTTLGKKGPSEESEEKDLLVNALVPLDPSLVCIKEQPNNKWFEFSELRAQFPLAHGNVIARIAPYEPNLRRVLEACADVTPQTQLPEPSPSEVKESSSEKEESSPNSSLFDSLKIQGKLLVP